MKTAAQRLKQNLLTEATDSYMGEVGVAVWDISTNEELFSHQGDTQFMMASTSKIFTIGTALSQLGPKFRVETEFCSSGAIDSQGVLGGDLYVKGAGDPSFGNRKHADTYFYGIANSTEEFPRVLKNAGIHRVEGSVVGDDSLFEQRPRPTGRLGALTFGRAQDERPALPAAQEITKSLTDSGIEVRGEARVGATPSSAKQLAVLPSPTLAELCIPAGRRSDNFIAETITKLLAVHVGGERPGTTSRGAQIITEFAASLGSEITQFDGSGLAFRNTVSPNATLNFMRRMQERSTAQEFEESLAVMGVDGTLHDRGRNTNIQGAVKAKTGTHLVRGSTAKVPGFRCSALTGYCSAPDGKLIAFCIMQEKPKSRYTALAGQERMVRSMMDYAENA